MTLLKIETKPNNIRLKVVIGLLMSAIFIITSLLMIIYPFGSKVKTDYFTGSHPIIFNGKQQGNALLVNESVYVPLSFMQEHIDETITFDEKSNSIIITTKDKVIQMPTESLTYFVNEKPVELQMAPLVNDDHELFVAIEPLVDYFPFFYQITKDTKAIWIRKDGEKVQHGVVTSKDVNEEKLRLRTKASIRSSYVATTKPKEDVLIEKEQGDYYFVRKEDGTAGYLSKSLVNKTKIETTKIEQARTEPTIPNFTGPINLTWEAVYTKNPDTTLIPQMNGVNVVSPTWFELQDEKGSVSNLASLEYTKWAKNRGYEVWALFSNAFDADLTHQAFKDFETRQTIIRELLHYSKMYEITGINLDIENVRKEDGPLVTQFVREATPYFHAAGLVVSMDITFISDSGNWSAFYEREKLASIVDYLAVMAYDEHWGSSPVAGSVASLPWVEEHLQALLEIVPSEKLILGVPLYTRLWEVADSGEVSSKAMSMTQIKTWLAENKVTPVFDELTGQNYAELYVANEAKTYKVWLEDEQSLQKRTELALKYNLAGVASWSRFFADETAWTALQQFNVQTAKK